MSVSQLPDDPETTYTQAVLNRIEAQHRQDTNTRLSIFQTSQKTALLKGRLDTWVSRHNHNKNINHIFFITTQRPKMRNISMNFEGNFLWIIFCGFYFFLCLFVLFVFFISKRRDQVDQ